MAASEFASQLRHQSLIVVGEVMEILHEMQSEHPENFSTLRFKIGVRGEREQSRVKHFGSYAGPDETTLQTLLANFNHWKVNPHLFWSNPAHALQGTSATGELIALYVNARSDDS